MGRGRGCHAEYVCSPVEACLVVPERLSMEEAAAIPNVFVTAHNAIMTTAHLQSGENILITAGSSGVGTAAIQIAQVLGANHIVATTRVRDKANSLAQLGATEVINTTDTDWLAQVASIGKIQVVIDQVGGLLFEGLLQVLETKGRYISVGRNDGPKAGINLDLLALKQLALHGVTFRTRTPAEALDCVTDFGRDLLDHFGSEYGRPGLAPVLDRVFQFTELEQAYHYLGQDQQVGKIVLSV